MRGTKANKLPPAAVLDAARRAGVRSNGGRGEGARRRNQNAARGAESGGRIVRTISLTLDIAESLDIAAYSSGVLKIPTRGSRENCWVKWASLPWNSITV